MYQHTTISKSSIIKNISLLCFTISFYAKTVKILFDFAENKFWGRKIHHKILKLQQVAGLFETISAEELSPDLKRLNIDI